MMDTNRCFSFSRLAMVMKRDLMENGKKTLYGFLGICTLFLAMYLLMMATDYRSLSGYINAHTSAFGVISAFYLTYAASEMMRNLRTKEARLSYLMLPATPLEKFASRAIFVTVGVMLMIFAALLMAEALHWLFIPLFKDFPEEYKTWVLPEVWERTWESINPFRTRTIYLKAIEGTDPSTWQRVERNYFLIVSMGYAATLWQHSIFVLGGNYFRKHPLIKTLVFMFLIGSLMGWMITAFDWDTLSRIAHSLEPFLKGLDENTVAGCISVVFLAFTALNWWLSYKLFTRRQVIEPKFRLP